MQYLKSNELYLYTIIITNYNNFTIFFPNISY